MSRIRLVLIAGILLLAMSNVLAQVPRLINYQGLLLDTNKKPVANGLYKLTFRIYEKSNNNLLWSEEHTTVTVTDGLFNVILGSAKSLNIGFDKPYLLGIQVGTDPELSPRMELTSTAYSLNADKVDGKEASAFVEKVDGVSPVNGNIDLVAGTNVTITPDNTNNRITISASGGTEGDNLGNHTATQNINLNGNWLSGDGNNEGVYVNGNGDVGIGTKNPKNTLHVKGWLNLQGSDFLMADSARGDGGRALVHGGSGNKTDDKLILNFGGDFEEGVKIDGSKCVVNGNLGIGTGDPSGAKLKVIQNDSDRAGYFQIVNQNSTHEALLVNTNNNREAIYATTYGTGRAGFFGINNTSNVSPALAAITNGKSGTAVLGLATNTDVFNLGGDFKAYGANGIGVMGEALSTVGLPHYGGWFYAKGSDGYGIRAEADGDNGVGIWAMGGKNGLAGDFWGKVRCPVLEIVGGSDIAEPFDIEERETIKAGMVVTIDPQNPGKLKIADRPYDRCVAGIISGAGNIAPGMIMGQKGTMADGEHPVALSGRVYCWADASNGSIQPGDLLTTSEIPGHAMKVADFSRAQGSILGKAISSLEKGQGLVLVLVTLQ